MAGPSYESMIVAGHEGPRKVEVTRGFAEPMCFTTTAHREAVKAMLSRQR